MAGGNARSSRVPHVLRKQDANEFEELTVDMWHEAARSNQKHASARDEPNEIKTEKGNQTSKNASLGGGRFD
jgi:hypothetical protein